MPDNAGRARYVPYIRHRNDGCRITEFAFHGLRCITLENQSLRVSIAADKGADIFEFLHKPSDTEFLLRTPLGLRAQGPVLPTIQLREGNFSDFYEGGWQELFPVAGDFPAEHKGAQFGQHGEVALLPWSYRIEDDRPERIAVKFTVLTTRTPFLLERTMILEGIDPVLQLRERVVNEGAEALEFMWAHHPAFGWPFLDEHCEVVLPQCEVVTLAAEIPSTSRLVEQVGGWPRVKGRQGETVDLSQMPGPEQKAHDLAFLRGFAEGLTRYETSLAASASRCAGRFKSFPISGTGRSHAEPTAIHGMEPRITLRSSRTLPYSRCSPALSNTATC